MAILFYEGLPGAGKSYEAMATQIIPMLQKGREVVAYIEGLDHEKIAEAADLPVDRVKELLFVLTREDMRARSEKRNGKDVAIDGLWVEKTRDNAYHVFDEAQNWWPIRHRPTDSLTQFVTEHRHRGIDVLLMGQSLKDVHALWRRRVDQKFVFLKLTALGTDKRYRVTIEKGQGNDEFVKVSDKLGKYDPKYFGTYKSHVSDDTNTETYTDSRVNVLKTPGLMYGVPLALALSVWGGYTAYKFFYPDAKPKVSTSAPGGAAPVASASVRPGVPSTHAAPAVPAEPPRKLSAQERHFTVLSENARPRLAGLLSRGDQLDGIVEWVDSGARVTERMSLEQLRALGVSVMQISGAVRLVIGEWDVIATMWPVESEGRVSETRMQMVRGAPEPGLMSEHPQVVVIGEPRGAARPKEEGIAAPLERQGSVTAARVPKSSPWSFQTGG